MADELEIMGKIKRLLEPLDAAARARTLAWVMDALEVQPSQQNKAGKGSLVIAAQPNANGFADLFHKAAPSSEKEKALIAAYWIQQSSGANQFASQQVNTELKHIGYRIANITDALSQLMGERPSLVIQLTKSGQSKQSRKTYKVTDAGFRYISAMLEKNS